MLAQIHFFELERDPSFLGDDVGRKRACTRGIIELDETILSLIDRCKVVLSATPMFDAKCGLGVGLRNPDLDALLEQPRAGPAREVVGDRTLMMGDESDGFHEGSF